MLHVWPRPPISGVTSGIVHQKQWSKDLKWRHWFRIVHYFLKIQPSQEYMIWQRTNAHIRIFKTCLFMFQRFFHSSTYFPNAAPPEWTQLSHPGQRGGPLSRPRRPRWWLPGIHSFSGTWTRSCGADPGICVSEVGRPQAEVQRSGASAPGRGPRPRLGPHPAPLPLLHLRLHLLCSPSRVPAECVHWGTKRK